MTKYLLRAIFLSQTNPVVTTKKKKNFSNFLHRTRKKFWKVAKPFF